MHIAEGQKKWFQDWLKAALKDFGIDVARWDALALVCPVWGSKFTKGAFATEARHIMAAEQK